MRYYEILYIVHPDFEEERLLKVQDDVNDRVKKLGAKIINSYMWGKRKLAYLVDKQKYGTYMMLQYETETPTVDELNSWMELNEAILAYYTVRLNQKPEEKELGESSGE